MNDEERLLQLGAMHALRYIFKVRLNDLNIDRNTARTELELEHAQRNLCETRVRVDQVEGFIKYLERRKGQK